MGKNKYTLGPWLAQRRAPGKHEWDIEGEGPLGTIENIIDHAIAKATGGDE